MTEEAKRKRFYFNVIAEAKMNAFVEMSLRNLPRDQVKQFCEVLLERALTERGL